MALIFVNIKIDRIWLKATIFGLLMHDLIEHPSERPSSSGNPFETLSSNPSEHPTLSHNPSEKPSQTPISNPSKKLSEMPGRSPSCQTSDNAGCSQGLAYVAQSSIQCRTTIMKTYVYAGPCATFPIPRIQK